VVHADGFCLRRFGYGENSELQYPANCRMV